MFPTMSSEYSLQESCSSWLLRHFRSSLVFVVCCFVWTAYAEPSRSILWYDRPAAYWEETLPVGNGRLGACVFGGTLREHLQLNEATLWSGEPEPMRIDPSLRRSRARAQEELLSGRYREAQQPAPATSESGEIVPGTSKTRHIYQPLGDLYLLFPGAPEPERHYRRSLDLDTAIVSTLYERCGVRYTREVFASHPAQAIVVRLEADRPGSVSFQAALDYRRGVGDDLYRYDTELGRRVAEVSTPPRPLWRAIDATHFSWQGRAHPEGVSFDARYEVRNEGGRVEASSEGFRVEGADAVTLIITVGTDFRGGDPARLAEEALSRLQGLSYAELRAAHVEDHRSLFRRVSIDLGRTRVADMPTNRRVFAQMWGAEDNRVDPSADRDPDLYALYFQFGRYLLIASSRPGGLPPALQGIWNDSILPPWFGQPTSDLNVEMNAWPTETTGLPECNLPLLDLAERFKPAAEATARLGYGARGIVMNTFSFFGPRQDSSEWPDFTGWLAQSFWDRYAFGGDRSYLEKSAYPYLRACALFYLDTLVVDPSSGKKLTSLSYSPENRFIAPDDGKPAAQDVGVTLSMAICREVFRNFLKAAEILDTDKELRREVGEALASLAPYRIDSEGRLLEWRTEYRETEPGHRHFSHLYPLYPGSEIDPRRTPELAAAARAVLLRRLENRSAWTGWSRAWAIALAARLHDSALAHEQLRLLLERTTFTNLMDSHPRQGGNTACFQIDGNFGATAALSEMLLQSHTGEIELLPALPAQWRKGSISGLRARGGFVVDQGWSGGKLSEATLNASLAGPCSVRSKQGFSVVRDGRIVAESALDHDSQVAHFRAEKGAVYSIRPR